MREILIKTLNKKNFILDLDEYNTIGFLKRQLAPFIKLPSNYLRIAHKGRVVSDETTLLDAGIENKDFVVVFPCKSGPHEMDLLPLYIDPEAEEASREGDKAEYARRDEISSGLSTPIPIFKGSPAIPSRRQGRHIPSIQVNSVALQSLKEMGFEENRCRKALIINRMNIQQSMEWLLEHADDDDADNMLDEGDLDDIQLEMDGFEPDKQILDTLVTMGFSRETVVEALFTTNNDQDSALSLLLGTV